MSRMGNKESTLLVWLDPKDLNFFEYPDPFLILPDAGACWNNCGTNRLDHAMAFLPVVKAFHLILYENDRTERFYHGYGGPLAILLEMYSANTKGVPTSGDGVVIAIYDPDSSDSMLARIACPVSAAHAASEFEPFLHALYDVPILELQDVTEQVQARPKPGSPFASLT